MKMARMAVIVVLIHAASVCSSQGRDIAVPREFTTLELALAAAEPGDCILLSPGRYLENNLSLRDSVALIGNPDDPAAVIIDGQGQGSIFRAEWLQDARLSGMTLTGGIASGSGAYTTSGAALLVSNASVHLDHVHFIGNQAAASGGAVRIGLGSMHAVHCIFEDNNAGKGGGAVDLSHEANAIFENILFRGNSAAWGGAISVRSESTCWLLDSELSANSTITPQELGGALFSDGASRIFFSGCVVAGNSARQGGAARLNGVESMFTNCTIDGNSAQESGGAFQVSDTHFTLYRSIISFNGGAALSGESSSLMCRATNIFGNQGGNWTGDLASMINQSDNLESDPLYCDTGVYYLQDESPCAPQNNPVGLIGALPADCENVGLFLKSFTATQQDRQINLAWSVIPGQHEFRLQGRALDDPADTAWHVPHTGDEMPGRYLATDTPAHDKGTLLYLLTILQPDDTWRSIGEIQIAFAGSIPNAPLSLDRIYPNPFNPQVNIRYTLARPAPVRAAVYDLQGRMLDQLVLEYQPAGSHHLIWNGQDRTGRSLPTGAYLLRLEGNGIKHTAKLLLVK